MYSKYSWLELSAFALTNLCMIILYVNIERFWVYINFQLSLDDTINGMDDAVGSNNVCSNNLGLASRGKGLDHSHVVPSTKLLCSQTFILIQCWKAVVTDGSSKDGLGNDMSGQGSCSALGFTTFHYLGGRKNAIHICGFTQTAHNPTQHTLVITSQCIWDCIHIWGADV